MADAAAPAAATEQQGSTTSTSTTIPHISEPVPSGPQRSPFAHPASSATIARPEPLTTKQTTAYNSLLNSVTTWRTIAASSDAADEDEHTPLGDDELIWLSRECLLRYLRASKWDVATAQSRLLNTLLWRRTYGLVSARPEEQKEPKLVPDYVSPENETGKQVLLGYDNCGRPCLYLNPSRQNTKRSERQIEHLVFMLERCIDLMPAGQETLALLINFADTKSGQGASVGQGKQTLNILQNHYPERLGRALLCNLPWHIWAFMKVITPFIDPVTRTKLVFDQPLSQHVPPEQLLKSHGGELASFEYEHATYWPALNRLAAERREAMRERWVAGGKRVGESELYLRGGTEVSLSQEEDGRLSREKESLSRGRVLQVDRAQRRDKSVSIVEGDEAAKPTAEEEEAKATGGEEAKPVDDGNNKADAGKTGLEEKVGQLEVKETERAANGEAKPTAAA